MKMSLARRVIAEFIGTAFLVAAVIGSAVIPTLIANAFFLPHHLLPNAATETVQAQQQVK